MAPPSSMVCGNSIITLFRAVVLFFGHFENLLIYSFINTHMLKFGLAKQKNIIFVQNDKMKFFSILTPFFQKNKEQYIRLLR